MTQHKRSIIQEPDFLGVGVAVSTHIESNEKEGKEWWYIYHQYDTWLGVDINIKCEFSPIYLEGAIRGINQTIKVEFSTEEKAFEAAEIYHPLAVKYATALKDILTAKTFISIGEKF